MKTPIDTTLTDMDLVAQTLAGQSDCFAELISRHAPAVRRCLKGMVRNVSDQEDLAQETLLKTWRSLPSFRADSSFRTWITRIAMNEAMQLYRRHRSNRSVAASFALEAIPGTLESPPDLLARQQANDALRSALKRLPDKYREVLILRDLREFTTTEAARHLDSGLPLVKSRLLRARKMLSKTMLESNAFQQS